MALVGIVIGSKTDDPLIKPALEILDQMDVSYELSILSAHRTPEKVRQYGLKAKEQGVEVIIAAAGSAAHLPGAIAGWTSLPVIGVPLPTSELKGIDSLYSIVQMPAGVPVACVGVGTAGVKNAALLATQILGLKHKKIGQAFERYKRKLAKS